MPNMFVKGWRVSYQVQHIWKTSNEQKHFVSPERAQEFYIAASAEAAKNNLQARIEEVAYVVIDNRPYCLGPALEFEAA